MIGRDRFVLPPGWAWTVLTEIAKIKGGITKGQRRHQTDVTRAVPYLRVGNVQRGHIDLSEVKLIEATEQEIEDLRLRAGDVLFNEGGDRDKLGRGWVWRGELPECIHQNHVFRARLRSSGIQPKYVSWYGNAVGQAYFIKEGRQTTNLASLNLTKLGGLPIALPPLGEQHRIVAEIDKHFTRLDAAVAALKRAQANLKRYRAAILNAACEGRLVPTEANLARAEGRNFEPAHQLLPRILKERRVKWEADQFAKFRANGAKPRDENWKTKYQEPNPADAASFPPLSEGWCWARLEQLLSLIRNGIGIPPRGASGLPMLRISALRPMHVYLDDYRFLDPPPADYQQYLLKRGDLLFTRYNGNPSLVGICGMVREVPRLTVHPDKLIRGTVASPLCDPRYLQLVLNTGVSREFVARRVRTTAGQSGVSGADLRAVPVPLAPLGEQHRIVGEAERRLSMVDALEKECDTGLKRVDRLRQSILKRAFEGKLVPQDSADEPAMALLARIKAERSATTPTTNGRHSKPPRPTPIRLETPK